MLELPVVEDNPTPIQARHAASLVSAAPFPILGTTIIVLIGLLHFRTLVDLVSDWWNDPGQSQGLLIPPLAAYMAWIHRSRTLSVPATGESRGLLVVLFSCLIFALGKFGAEFFLIRISLILLLIGVILTFWGYQRLRTLALPLLLLFTMIPLPMIVYNNVSTPLQLFASDTAAKFIQSLGVTVYRDGNVIDLATIQLGVEEACSGLHSLSSMVIAGSLLGVLLCRQVGSRVALVFLSVPIALCANILRITGTALLAGYNPKFAMGFYHVFSGWLIFVFGFFSLCLVGKTLHACFD